MAAGLASGCMRGRVLFGSLSAGSWSPPHLFMRPCDRASESATDPSSQAREYVVRIDALACAANEPACRL